MRAVDPAMQLAGPTTARGVQGNAQAYLELLMRSGDPKPDIAPYTPTGSHDERDLDRCLFDGYASGNGCMADGIAGLTQDAGPYTGFGRRSRDMGHGGQRLGVVWQRREGA
jgi:hypothetical protein